MKEIKARQAWNTSMRHSMRLCSRTTRGQIEKQIADNLNTIAELEILLGIAN